MWTISCNPGFSADFSIEIFEAGQEFKISWISDYLYEFISLPSGNLYHLSQRYKHVYSEIPGHIFVSQIFVNQFNWGRTNKENLTKPNLA